LEFKVTRFIRVITLLGLTLLPGHARAEDEDDDRKITYKQKTEIDFEGLEIEGVLQKPQSALVLERKKANFNPLIKLRTDWNDAIDQSVDEVK
jgi:hypothetical protein